MKGNYTRVDLIQNYDIRDVCIDCKHIYETYEYDGELDEEFHYILCDKNGCVLLYVEEGYDFEEVSKMIYEAIHQQKKTANKNKR